MVLSYYQAIDVNRKIQLKFFDYSHESFDQWSLTICHYRFSNLRRLEVKGGFLVSPISEVRSKKKGRRRMAKAGDRSKNLSKIEPTFCLGLIFSKIRSPNYSSKYP